MARRSTKPKLPPPLRPIVRACCWVCGQTRAVYEGTIPRMWLALQERVVCTRPTCREAARDGGGR